MKQLISWQSLDLPINKEFKISDYIKSSFYIVSLDFYTDRTVSELPDFTLALDNNIDNLFTSKTHLNIDFNKDPDARGNYLPQLKRIIKAYEYCFLFASVPIINEQVKLYYRLK